MPKRHRKKLTSSKPAKRRPPSSTGTAEQYFTIRDIISEKHEAGKLLYLVDWDDDPTTGEKYKPTWEPHENVTAAAIEDWELKKLHSQGAKVVDSSSPPSELESDSQLAPLSQPAQTAQSGPKRQRSRSLSAKQDDVARPPKRARTKDIVVHIPVVPDVDPNEYIFVIPSQLFTVPQAVDSPRTIPDSQEDSGTQSTPAATIEPAHSQLTDPAEAEAVEDLELEASQGGQVLELEVSHTDIPSDQPDSATHHHDSPSFLLEHQSSPGSPSPDPSLEPTEALVDEDDLHKDSSLSGFLTQPDYDIPLPSQEVDNSTRNSPPTSASSSFNFQRASSSPILSEQAAQPVHSFQIASTHGLEHFRTESQEALPHSQAILDSNAVSAQEFKATVQESNSLGSGSFVSAFATVSGRTNFHSLETGSGHLFPGRNSFSHHFRMDPPRDAVQELRDALLKSSQRTSTPSGFLEGTNETVPSQTPVFRDAVEELKSTIPRFEFAQTAAESAFQSRPEAPKQRSAIDELNEGITLARQRQTMDVDPSPSPFQYSNSISELSAELPVLGTHSETFAQLPTTVAPSDLTTSVELPHVVDHEPIDMLTDNTEFCEDARPDTSSGYVHDHEQPDHDRTEFIVTLPLASSARAVYLATIREYHDVMVQFGKSFSESLYAIPEAQLVAKMDTLFGRLQAVCDLPAYDEKMHDLESEEMMKHATNSNSKYSFLYEFLTCLSDTSPRILVISQPGRVFDYLEAVIKTTSHSYKVLGKPDASAEDASLILADSSQDLSSIRGGIEVVILFDKAARSANLPVSLGYVPTTMLSLVAAYSLEHIELQIQREHPNIAGLEKQNALNLITAALRRYLESPERGIVEPHLAAPLFANYIRNPDSGIDYDTHELPEDVFDVWLNSSQIQTSQVEASDALNSRKRHIEEDNLVIAKRPKTMINSVTGPISDLLRDFLAKHDVEEESSSNRVEVSVALLERLAAKEHNLEEQLAAQTSACNKYRELAKNQELQRLSWEKSLNSLQPAYHEALKDRKQFETDCKAAQERASAAVQQLETSKAQTKSLKEKVRALESELASIKATLDGPSIPDAARIGQLERELRQERDGVQAMKNRADGMQEQAAYLRERHVDSTNKFHGQQVEIKNLQAEIARLNRRDIDAAVEINRMHVQSEHELTTKQFEEFKVIIHDREQELSRLRQELQAYKSSRRETRSPRIMSPRPSRGATAAGSRGTSPALPTNSDPAAPGGMNYIGGNNSRLSHLRVE
ncbi:hypothetical protein QBC38DRAFT_42437 [Podospora fimiseda]|uniref:Chromo domain-containing protein n=1 Tax=Podospora fimiseda TaxID=252190 RepID=A0AAN7BW02_9PEZI|nr:hypothetical protein QBC38DRAFT_42437 [Podospora fimiseda]